MLRMSSCALERVVRRPSLFNLQNFAHLRTFATLHRATKEPISSQRNSPTKPIPDSTKHISFQHTGRSTRPNSPTVSEPTTFGDDNDPEFQQVLDEANGSNDENGSGSNDGSNVGNGRTDNSLLDSEKNRLAEEEERYSGGASSQVRVRLNTMLPRAGVCSRRQAEKLIKEGKVVVDNEVVTDVGRRVIPFEHSFVINGHKLKGESLTKFLVEPKLYAYHKPRGELCSRTDDQGRPTIFQSTQKLGLNHLMKIGRLDYNSEGLLLLTNDGKLARYMEHPRTHMERVYLVRIQGRVTQAHLDQFVRGATIKGVQYGRMEAKLMDASSSSASWIKVRLWEGKNREIRKVFEHMNMQVARLIRIQYGPYKLTGDIRRKQAVKVKLTEYLLKQCNDQYLDALPDTPPQHMLRDQGKQLQKHRERGQQQQQRRQQQQQYKQQGEQQGQQYKRRSDQQGQQYKRRGDQQGDQYKQRGEQRKYARQVEQHDYKQREQPKQQVVQVQQHKQVQQQQEHKQQQQQNKQLQQHTGQQTRQQKGNQSLQTPEGPRELKKRRKQKQRKQQKQRN